MQLRQENGRLKADRLQLTKDKDAAANQIAQLSGHNQSLMAERERILKENARLVANCDQLAKDKEQAAHQNALLTSENQTLSDESRSFGKRMIDYRRTAFS